MHREQPVLTVKQLLTNAYLTRRIIDCLNTRTIFTKYTLNIFSKFYVYFLSFRSTDTVATIVSRYGVDEIYKCNAHSVSAKCTYKRCTDTKYVLSV